MFWPQIRISFRHYNNVDVKPSYSLFQLSAVCETPLLKTKEKKDSITDGPPSPPTESSDDGSAEEEVQMIDDKMVL